MGGLLGLRYGGLSCEAGSIGRRSIDKRARGGTLRRRGRHLECHSGLRAEMGGGERGGLVRASFRWRLGTRAGRQTWTLAARKGGKDTKEIEAHRN